jgi:hypothetical protein
MTVANPANATISTVLLNKNALLTEENIRFACADRISLVFQVMNPSLLQKMGMKRFLSWNETIGISPLRRRRR